jgi:hypothetical protein
MGQVPRTRLEQRAQTAHLSLREFVERFHVAAIECGEGKAPPKQAASGTRSRTSPHAAFPATLPGPSSTPPDRPARYDAPYRQLNREIMTLPGGLRT